MVHPEIVFYISFKTYKRFVHAIKIICLEMIVFLFINVFYKITFSMLKLPKKLI